MHGVGKWLIHMGTTIRMICNIAHFFISMGLNFRMLNLLGYLFSLSYLRGVAHREADL